MSTTFFGIQIALVAPPGSPLRREFVEAVRRNGGDQSLVEKRAFHQRVADLLDTHAHAWAFGTWDYVGPPQGESEFDSWVAGLEESVEENPGDEVDDDHIVVTLVYLLDAGSDAESTAGERCDLPVPMFFRRSTFKRLVATVRMLSFAGVRADGAYVVPGEGGPGLSAEELTGEGWDYLKPLED
jgi:predicted amidohydrolase YtcJ